MSTRRERDEARVRILTVAICSLRCELARVVQAAEDPDSMTAYALKSLAKGETEDGIFGLSQDDLVNMLGPITAAEKLVSLGASWSDLRSAITGSDDENPEMQRDILLYVEGICLDRSDTALDETTRPSTEN